MHASHYRYNFKMIVTEALHVKQAQKGLLRALGPKSFTYDFCTLFMRANKMID